MLRRKIYAKLGWIDQPMQMRETSRGEDKKLHVNNYWAMENQK
jgi:hypothetical protein